MSFPFVSLLNSPYINELAMLGELCDRALGRSSPREEELMHPHSHVMSVPLSCGYVRPWRTTTPVESGVSHLQNDFNGFKVSLDVQQFKPEELKVKVVDDFIVVEAKHDEQLDRHGWVARQFTRRYKIPEDTDISALKSELTSDGILILHAPKKVLTEDGHVREIPINLVNSLSIKSSENSKQEDKMKANSTK